MPDELETRLTRSQVNELVAFLKVWPDGADVMDRRFEALTMRIDAGLDRLAYVVNRSAGGKMAKPKAKNIGQYKIFERVEKRLKRFDQMTQEEIHKRMTRFSKGL